MRQQRRALLYKTIELTPPHCIVDFMIVRRCETRVAEAIPHCIIILYTFYSHYIFLFLEKTNRSFNI